MALDSQNLPISFGQGVDTKTDPKQVVPGKLVVLQNASFKTLKEIKKRDGFKPLSKNILGGGTVSSGVGISSYLGELTSLDGSKLYSYSPELDKQIDHGLLVPVDLSVSSVIRSVSSQVHPDEAYHSTSGLKCFLWSDTGFEGQNVYSVIDSGTNNIVAPATQIPDTSGKAKVLCLGDRFIFIYYDEIAFTLSYQTIDVTNPRVLGSPVVIASDISTDVPAFDATVINGSVFVTYRKGTTQIAFYSISPTLVLSSQYVVTVGNAVDSAITVKGDSSFNVWVSYSTTTHLYTFIVNQALNATLLAPVTVDAALNATGGTCYNVTMVIIGTLATIFYEQFGATSAFVKKGTVTFTGTVVTGTKLILRVGLASKAIVYNGVPYVLVIYAGDKLANPATGQSTQISLEPTYFLINSSGKTVLKLCPSLAMCSYFTNGLLPEIADVSSSEFSFAYLIQDAEPIPPSNGNVQVNTGVMAADIDFSIAHPVSKLTNASNLHLASGQLWMYDGNSVVEHGFHIYPENLTAGSPSPGGGIGPSVSYNATGLNQVQYIALYQWLDNQGQTHQSATSPVATVQLPYKSSITEKTFTANCLANSTLLYGVSTFTGIRVGQVLYDKTNATNLIDGTYIKAINPGGGTITLSSPALGAHTGDAYGTIDVLSVAVTIPTLTLTEKELVTIYLYRTENNGSIFYETGAFAGNNTTVESITLTDTAADNYIIGNKQLYTTGGEVSNFNAPALSVVTSFKNRVAYLSPENPYQWGYSKEILPGVPVEFSSLLFFENIDQKVGKLTAAGQLDDKFILFGPSSKYYVVGSGPSPSGANNDFTDAIKIVGVSGCENQASVLELPIGVIFQDTQKGFWLLDRSLQEKYIGAEVEQFNSFKTTSSNLVPNSTKASFTLENGTNLVYDYYIGQWETDVYPLEAVDSTVFENEIVYIQSDGQILEQTPDVFSDNGLVIPFSLETGWMNLAGITGFQRVWELQILGEYKSPHTLTVYTFVDNSDVPAQTTVIPVLSDPGLYNYRITMKQQKCTSIRFQIVETQDPASPGEGLSLSALGLRVGVKRGLNKLPAGKSY